MERSIWFAFALVLMLLSLHFVLCEQVWDFRPTPFYIRLKLKVCRQGHA